MYTRALASVPVDVPASPAESTFEWIKQPVNGIAEGTVYTDGSLLDNQIQFAGMVARRGWAFAAFEADGSMSAAARGRPPIWAEGIHATELWALLMAVQSSAPSCPLRIDCLAVQQGSQKGAQWATAPNRVFARAWGPLAASLEDDPHRVVWMPAHCTQSDIGHKFLSDGTMMQDMDVVANAFVDRHAKSIARQDGVPPQVKQRIAHRWARVTAIAKWIGQCTVLAGEVPGPVPDEKGKFSKIRDTEGQHARKVRPPPKACLPQTRPERVPSVVGQLPLCPRWEAVRQRVAARAALRASSAVGEV